jgi:hypothetical protein
MPNIHEPIDALPLVKNQAFRKALAGPDYITREAAENIIIPMQKAINRTRKVIAKLRLDTGPYAGPLGRHLADRLEKAIEVKFPL